MAQSMALRNNTFKAGVRPRAHKRAARAPVAVRATKHEVSFTERLAPALLAGIVAFTGLSPAFTPPARAEDEELMTPYQRRQLEMERRRELLREARERAAARAAGDEVAEPAAPTVAEPKKEQPTDFSAQAARLKKESLKAYEDAAKNRPTLPATQEPEEDSTPAPAFPKFGGFSFSKPAEAPAPAAPAPAVPAPPAPQPAAPAPKPVVPPPPPPPAPVRKVEEKKPEPAKPATPAVEQKKQTAAVSKKRRGPLPLWFAEILVLGAYVGLGLAATKYSDQTGKVLSAVGAKIVELYKAIEKLVNKKTQPSA